MKTVTVEVFEHQIESICKSLNLEYINNPSSVKNSMNYYRPPILGTDNERTLSTFFYNVCSVFTPEMLFYCFQDSYWLMKFTEALCIIYNNTDNIPYFTIKQTELIKGFQDFSKSGDKFDIYRLFNNDEIWQTSHFAFMFAPFFIEYLENYIVKNESWLVFLYSLDNNPKSMANKIYSVIAFCFKKFTIEPILEFRAPHTDVRLDTYGSFFLEQYKLLNDDEDILNFLVNLHSVNSALANYRIDNSYYD